MKNGAVYVRVSTEDQARDGFSIDAQLKAIKNYASKNNIFIDPQYIFKDEGISGRKAEKRPAFMEMIKQAKLKKFDIILVHKMDRFARNRQDSVVYKSLLRKDYNVQVVSITENIEDDKFGIILEAILEAMAEYYSINLSEEVLKGMIEKHSRGELQTKASYGYDAKDGVLVINEEQAKIIKYIFEKFTLENMPMLAITKNLNSLGLKTNRGNKFENRTCYYILNNPVYIGKLRFTPKKRKFYDFDNPDTIIIDGKHTPIISKEIWDKTQQKLSENAKWKKPHMAINAKSQTWLKGLVRCKECGCTYVFCGKDHLRCNGYNKGKCKNYYRISVEQTKNTLIEQIKYDITVGKINNIIVPKKTKISNNDFDMLNYQLKQLNIKEERIKEAYRNGIDTIEEYKENKQILLTEKEKIKEQLSKVEKPAEANYKKEIIENGKKVYEILIDKKIPEEEKNKVIHSLLNKAEFDSETEEFTLYYN